MATEYVSAEATESTEATEATEGDLMLFRLGVMYLGALGIRLFLGLGVSGCGILDGVVLAEVDMVEDMLDPGDIGNLEPVHGKVGEPWVDFALLIIILMLVVAIL